MNECFFVAHFLQDGHLKKEDLLLQINEKSVLHMASDDVIASLKSVSVAGMPIKLVVARAVEEAESGIEQGVPLEINDVRGKCEHAWCVNIYFNDVRICILLLNVAGDDSWLSGVGWVERECSVAAEKKGRGREGERKGGEGQRARKGGEGERKQGMKEGE